MTTVHYPFGQPAKQLRVISPLWQVAIFTSLGYDGSVSGEIVALMVAICEVACEKISLITICSLNHQFETV